MTYKHNIDFFDEETPLNSYWAGYLAADGAIYKYKTCRNSSLFFKLGIKDLEVLYQFKKDIQATNKIHILRTEPSCNLILSLTEKEELILKYKWQIVNKKSLIYTYPKLKNNKCKLAFIKGYLDGDGSIYLNTNPNTPRSEFNLLWLGSEATLNWIKEVINDVRPDLNIQNKLTKKDDLYRLKINGYKASEIGKTIYNSINRGLDRKWSKLLNYTFIDKRKLRNGRKSTK